MADSNSKDLIGPVRISLKRLRSQAALLQQSKQSQELSAGNSSDRGLLYFKGRTSASEKLPTKSGLSSPLPCLKVSFQLSCPVATSVIFFLFFFFPLCELSSIYINRPGHRGLVTTRQGPSSLAQREDSMQCWEPGKQTQGWLRGK